MKTLYFDCFSGASGNMILGGLFALGIDPAELKSEILKLGISDFDLVVKRVDRSGISAIHVETEYREERHHRHLPDIVSIIDGSGLNESVKTRAKSVFELLAAAEAKVHGIDIAKVHFHEVGAMDAIIDVVGASIGFEMLQIDRFLCSKIHVGSGFVEIEHGKYPVPPPAVAELLTGKPIYSTEIEGELITPTGAAIIASVCTGFGGLAEFTPEMTGYGAGTREFSGFPNALRMIVGESNESSAGSRESLVLLETNLDDCTGEVLGSLMSESLAAGALDCWFTPIQMKKSRPGTLVSILCRASEREILSELIYTETSAIGIRIQIIDRECLDREIVSVETKYGPVDVKLAKLKGRVINIKPEFEQIRAAAKANGIETKRMTFELAAICAERYEGARIVGTKAFGGSR